MSYFNLFIYAVYFTSVNLTAEYALRLLFYSLLDMDNFISLNILTDKRFVILISMAGMIFFVEKEGQN